MTATLMLMSSAWLAGADPAPAPVVAAPSAIVQTPCCGNSVYSAPVAAQKPKLRDRIKDHFKKPAPATSCDTCDPCASSASRPNLLDKLRERFGKRKSHATTTSCGCGCLTSGYSPIYGTSTTPSTSVPTTTDSKKTPMEMPPKSDPKPDVKKGGSDVIPPAVKNEPKKLDPKVTPQPKSSVPNVPAVPKVPGVTDKPAAAPKPASTVEGLNIPQLPSLPSSQSLNSGDVTPGIVPVSSPKLNGASSPY